MRYFRRTRLIVILFLLIVFNQIGFGQRARGFRRSEQVFFIENKGQIKDQNGRQNNLVRYILPLRSGMNIQLLKNGFSYDTYQRETAGTSVPAELPGKDRGMPGRQKPVKLRFHRVDIEFAGASSDPQLLAEDRLPQRYNYAKGTMNGPLTIEASQYKKVTYKNLYPLIDLVFQNGVNETGGSAPEYYFIIHPGGDPNAIRWKYHGALTTSLADGAIYLSVTHARIKEHIPACYQDTATLIEKALKPAVASVRCRYKAINMDTYAFAVSHYNRAKDLIIDPTPDLIWGTYYGGEGVDWGYCTAICPDGNVIFGGSAGSFSGIATAGAYQVTMDGYNDGMIGKFSQDGSLLWATYYGGSSYENIWGVAVDKNNNVYALGNTFSNDGIATPGTFKTTRTAYNGCTNGFLAKFTPDGRLIWGTYYGGEWDDEPYAITVDRNNDIVFCGGTSSMTGIASPGGWQSTYADGVSGQQVGNEDVFLAKFSSDGVRKWSTYYGGVGFDRGYGVAIDPDNNILLTGNTYSTGMATAGTFQPSIDVPGTESAFLSKFSAGGTLLWGTYFGKGGYPKAGGVSLSVASDNVGNSYVGGYTCCTSNIGTPGAMQENIGAANQYGDGFLVKFDKNGARRWGTYCGGPSTDYVNGVATDGANSVWITGMLGTPTNAVTPNSYQPSTTSMGTAFVTKFDSTGTRLWGTYYGITVPGDYGGEGRAIVTDGLGSVFVVGHTGTATSNIATCGAVQQTLGGNGDAFIAKFGQAAIPSILITADHAGTICPGTSVLLTAQTQNGGTSPSIEWLLNGQPLPGNSPSLSLNHLADGDSVRCLLVLNPACATGTYSSNSLIFRVDPGLTPSVSISTSSDTICPGTSTNFTAVETNGGDQPYYQWTINGMTTGADSAHFSSISFQTGDIVLCKLIHRGSCIPDSVAVSNQISLFVIPTPPFGVSIAANSEKACSGTPIAFTATPYASASGSYRWEVNGSPVGVDTPFYSSSQFKNGDQILCLLSASDAKCTYPAAQSNLVQVSILPISVITITGDSIISKGKSTQLTVQASGNPVSYAWTPDTAISNPSIADPVVSPLVTTTYSVNVISDEGCSAAASFTVKVITRITIPSAFSPNADGKNDVFRASYGSDISNVRFCVFDRWGQLLFIDRGTRQGWDGSIQGKQQPPGTYVWIFEYEDSSGVSRVLKGTVELIR